MMTRNHLPDGGAWAALHHALDADVDAGADPDQGLAHLVIILIIRWSAHIASSSSPLHRACRQSLLHPLRAIPEVHYKMKLGQKVIMVTLSVSLSGS